MEGNTELQNKGETQPRGADFRQRVEDRFNLAFGEVFQKDMPQVHVDIFFTYHETPKDLEFLDEEIRKADIYIPETFGWKPKNLKLLRKSSSGKISDAELTKKLKGHSASFSKTAEQIYGSNKAIDIIDVPANHELEKESREVWDYNPPCESDFAESLNYTKTFLGNIASYLSKREEYILSQITPEKIEELLNLYPALRDQKSIEILLSLGIGHSPVLPDFPENSFTDQGIITRSLRREVNDELAAKIYLESFLETLFRERVTKDSRKISSLKRIVVNELNIRDAQRIFNYCKGQEIFIFPRSEFYRIFDEKDIKIPHTEEELDAFLAKPLPRSDTIQE